MTRQAQHAPREEKITLTDLLTKFWPVLAALFLFILTGFSIKKTQDYQELRLRELEQEARDNREMLIEIRSDIKYLKIKTDEKTK